MANRTLETDYLVVGSGAAGMAFVDSLVTETDSDVIMVDRRHAPGGHWNDAYPFVRLHQPSVYYGVNSTPLGSETIRVSGPETGMYDRSTAAEICAYYQSIMHERLLASGQVRFFPQCDYVSEHRFVSCLTGSTFDVKVRKKLVDTSYIPPSIPATSTPPFEIGEGVRCVPVNQLAQLRQSPEGYVILGGGKTAMDTCVWLLENGVDPAVIRWIRPREAWLFNRAYVQPADLVGRFLLGIAMQLEAASKAASIDDLFDRLEVAEQLRRIDRSVRPTMHKGATIGDWELELLRRIENVVRLGHVRRIERDRIVLDRGTIPTSADQLHVHCAADGLGRPRSTPIFSEGRITMQSVRYGSIPFNAALLAFVEAHRDDDAEKNRLCPPNPQPDTALDWARMTLHQLRAENAWSREPDIAAWLEGARLNTMRGLRRRAGDPEVQAAMQRYVANVRPGLARLEELLATARA